MKVSHTSTNILYSSSQRCTACIDGTIYFPPSRSWTYTIHACTCILISILSSSGCEIFPLSISGRALFYPFFLPIKHGGCRLASEDGANGIASGKKETNSTGAILCTHEKKGWTESIHRKNKPSILKYENEKHAHIAIHDNTELRIHYPTHCWPSSTSSLLP